MILDECPSLASVAQFLATQEETKNAEPATMDAEKELIEVEQVALDAAALVRSLALLQRERALVALAVATEQQMQNPSTHTPALVKTLREYDVEREYETSREQEVAQYIVSLIKPWFDAEFARCRRQLDAALVAAKWPQQDPALGEIASDVKALAQLDEDAMFTAFAKPIGDRLVFHFRDSVDTAQADKPEWLFSYINDIIDRRSGWLNNKLRTLVAQPLDGVLRALAPALVRSAQTYLRNAHYVAELLRWAARLENQQWISMETTDILINRLIGGDAAKEKLVLAEARRCATALAQFIDENIDFDVDTPSAKPTFAALHVAQLLQQADLLVRLDPDLVVSQVHAPIVDTYIERLQAQLNAYDRTHSSLARAVAAGTGVAYHGELSASGSGSSSIGSSGGSTPAEIELSSVKTLSAMFGSASYLIGALERWSMQLIVADAAAEFVPESLAALTTIRNTAAARIAAQLQRTVQRSLKKYFRIDWRDCTDSGAELRQVRDATRPALGYVNQVCASSGADRARITAPFADLLAQLLWRLVLQANVFSVTSANVVRSDIARLWSEWRLPELEQFNKLAEAAEVLETGELLTKYLSQEDAKGLLKRRV